MLSFRLSRRFPGGALVATAMLSLTTAATATVPPCAGDVDGDGVVGFADLTVLLSSWGPCAGCPGDLDGSGSVDFVDLTTLLASWGPCTFAYPAPRPHPEAEQIVLQMLGDAGAWTAPDDLYDRAVQDLAAIRLAHPGLTGETNSPLWSATTLIVKKIAGAPQDKYQAMNAYMQVVSETVLFGDWWVVTFPAPLNMPAMALVYSSLPGIEYAEVNGFIGGENFYEATVLGGGEWAWLIDDGSWDCFDGCDCHTFYDLRVSDAGVVTTIDIWQWNMPWCPVKK